MPWSAMRLAGIFDELARQPGYTSLMEARLARQCLSQFWLSAPVDQLEMVYRSESGDGYRVLLGGPLVQEPLLHEEQAWRDALSQSLMTAFDRPETTNVSGGSEGWSSTPRRPNQRLQMDIALNNLSPY